MQIMALIFLILNPAFAVEISFTKQQCERFQADGITGGDYYINEALTRDCDIRPPADGEGYFMPLVLKDNPQSCEMKSLALNDSNSGYLQDVVTFNNMHPDYFYPDRDDEYPFVFALRVPDNLGGYYFSNGVAVDINTISGCGERLESLLGNKFNSKNIILTTAHSLTVNEGSKKCRFMNQLEINKSILASGPDVGNKPFATKLDSVACSAKSCDEYKNDINNDFCIIITQKKVPHLAKFEKLRTELLDQGSVLVAYQPTLISKLKNRNIRNSERMISVNKDGHLLKNKNKIMNSNQNFIIHHADLAGGSSGGGLFNKRGKLIGLNIAQGISDDKNPIQRGFKYTSAVNYAIDPQIACQRLTHVLK